MGRPQGKASSSQSPWDPQLSGDSSIKRNTFSLQRDVHVLPGTARPTGRRNNGLASSGQLVLSCPGSGISGARQESDAPGGPCPRGCGVSSPRPRKRLARWPGRTSQAGGCEGRWRRRLAQVTSVTDTYHLLPALLSPRCPGTQSQHDGEICPVRPPLGRRLASFPKDTEPGPAARPFDIMLT